MDIYKDGKLNSIRNKDGIWINSNVFREEANHFLKYGYYCADHEGSPAWIDYYTEQRNRIMNGYEVAGVKITGEHYFYLNFSPIKKLQYTGNKRKGSKVESFPDFWDGDYNYFWARYIARNGLENLTSNIVVPGEKDYYGKLSNNLKSLYLEVDIDPLYLTGGYNIIVGKSRRKGYSYKNGSIAVVNYITKPNSLTVFAANDSRHLYPQGIFNKAYDIISFLNKNTGFRTPSDVINKNSEGHIKNSYYEYIDGVKVEGGLKSTIMSVTCKDNPNALRGKDIEDGVFEESGDFGVPGHLKKTYQASIDCFKAGEIQTGLCTIFGTSGEMEKGTADYAHMFNNPLAYSLLPFRNVWDSKFRDTYCGFFHPFNWNSEGYYDEQGNSFKEEARTSELERREQLRKEGATSEDIQSRMQEKPLTPAEAFGSVSFNNFPVFELNLRLQYVKAYGLDEIQGIPIELYREKNKVYGKPLDFNSSITPIRSLHNEPISKRSAFIVYEPPIPNAPQGLYKIGYDPVRQNNGSSLVGITVYKGYAKEVGGLKNTIVAYYCGRLPKNEDNDELALMIAQYYNTALMHENEVTSTKSNFRKWNKLNWLAAQPDAVISKNIKQSRTNRVYGCHMNIQLKDAAESYTKDWLLTVIDYDEHDTPITVIDTIYSVRLLEELIAYHRKGNFDLVSSLFMTMIQNQEEILSNETEEDYTNKSEEVEKLLKKLYRKR